MLAELKTTSCSWWSTRSETGELENQQNSNGEDAPVGTDLRDDERIICEMG